MRSVILLLGLFVLIAIISIARIDIQNFGSMTDIYKAISAFGLNISIFIGIVGAASSYFITYFINIRIDNRKSQLKFTSEQIQFLYGPIFSLCYASGTTMHAFHGRYRERNESFFREEKPPTEDELKQWRLWMREVFMPLNIKMEQTIINNAHLIEGAEMPEPFKQLLAHVEAYKAILKRWDADDFSEHVSFVPFPTRSLLAYVKDTFDLLKHRQAALSSRMF